MLPPRIIGQDHRDGRTLAAGVSVLINEVAHGAQMRGVFGQCCADGRLECLRAMGGEQLQQSPGEHTQMDATLGGAQEQRLCTGCGVLQAILRAMRPGGAFVGHQSLNVGGLFDLRATVEAARVRGDDVLAIEDAHGIEAREQRERTVHMRVRDGVIAYSGEVDR